MAIFHFTTLLFIAQMNLAPSFLSSKYSIDDYSQSQNVISQDDVNIAFTRVGNKSFKEVIVFVHGWSCDRTYWKDQITEFSQDYQVVTIDLGGHGESSKGSRTDWTIKAYASDVLAVIRTISYEKIHLVGHSMGSMVVLEAVTALDPKTVSVTCVDYLKEKLNPRPVEKVEVELVFFEKNFVPMMQQFTSSMFLPNADPRIKTWVVDDMAKGDVEVAISSAKDLSTYDFTNTIKAVVRNNIPRYIINTDVRPTDKLLYQEELNFSVDILKNSGHFLMMEKPSEFNNLLRSFIETKER